MSSFLHNIHEMLIFQGSRATLPGPDPRPPERPQLREGSFLLVEVRPGGQVPVAALAVGGAGGEEEDRVGGDHNGKE